MQQMSKLIVRCLSRGTRMDEDAQAICLYGIDIFLYTLISTIGLLLIGTLAHRFFEAAIWITLYYLNQTFGGGYHATSHLKCFITMAVSLAACLLLLAVVIPLYLQILLLVVSSMLLFLFPLRLHENKRHLAKCSRFFVIRYRCILLLEFCIAILLLLASPGQYAEMCMLGVATSAISRIVGIVQDKVHHIT